MKRWQLIFNFGWWDFDVVWKKYWEADDFYWWRIGPFELRIMRK